MSDSTFGSSGPESRSPAQMGASSCAEGGERERTNAASSSACASHGIELRFGPTVRSTLRLDVGLSLGAGGRGHMLRRCVVFGIVNRQ